MNKKTLKLDDIIAGLPESDQRAIYRELAKKFKIRENAKLTREQKLALCGKILALMKDFNASEMKKVLNFTLKTVQSGMDTWKNENRDTSEEAEEEEASAS